MGIETQTASIPLGKGLDTKSDERVLDAPSLTVCRDVEFEEIGGLQTRKPFVAITNSVSNTLTGIRRLAVYGEELVAFTETGLWSYSALDGLWTERAEHLAVKVDETSAFVRTGEQFDCDRVEKSGVTMFTWSETTPTGTLSYVAALDSATGSIRMSPVSIKAGATRPKLLATTNKIYLVYAVMATPALWYRVYDPADLTTTSETSQTITSMVSFDAIVDENTPTNVITVASRASQYTISRYTETPSQVANSSKARTADGAICVAIDNANNKLCVVISNGALLRGDILNIDLSDDVVATAILTAYSTTVNQITAAYNDSGVCHIFVSSAEATGGSTSWGTHYGSLDNSGAAGGTDELVNKCGVASRAFKHNGEVFAWLTFGGVSGGIVTAQLQNTYFLYKVDGTLVSKAVATQGGGLSPSEGHLPSVQDLGSNRYAWAGVKRGIIPLGQGQKGYAAKSPQEVVFEFDSDDARRTVQLGETLYVTGGQLLQYDGQSLVEVGFHVFPWDLSIIPVTGTLVGTFNWQQTYYWANAKGEIERSTTATIFAALTATHAGRMIGENLHVTKKTGVAGEVACEFWRGVADAAVGTPFYLVTSKDPATTGVNGYVENVPNVGIMASFDDNMADSDLISKEIFPEAGGAILENLSAPSAKVIHATQDRLILAGIAGHPYRLVYSKLREPGSVASFHEALAVELPPEGGAITGIGFLNETLIVFKERAVFALPGDGYDNGGGGSNYGPARILANDVGCTSDNTLALTPKGLVFHSHKGWYLLNRGWSAGYIGAPVEDFNDDTFVSAFTVEDKHQVRICSTSRVLCWDYLVNQWSEWTVSDAVHSVVWNGVQHYASSTGTGDDILAQESNWDNNTAAFGVDIETPWLKLDGLQGYQRIREIAILGEYASASRVKVQIAYNYDDTWVDTTYWTPTPGVVGDAMQVVHNPSKQKCQAIKIRISAQAVGSDVFPTGEAFKLSGIQVEYAVKRGRWKGLPVGQKQ